MKRLACCSALILAAFVVTYPIFCNRESAKSPSCTSNLKQMAVAINLYSQDFDDRFPLAGHWTEDIFPYIKNESTFRCPQEDDMSQPSYALLRGLGGVEFVDMASPEKTVMIFSIPGRNRTGGAGLLPDPPRHNDGHLMGFVDGHTKWIGRATVSEVNWQPTLSPKTRPHSTVH
jgi:Protein of unknown function (DUF1559).